METVKKRVLILCTAALAGCNLGTTSSDIQNANSNNPLVATINLTATNCRNISSNGNVCTVTVTYYAPANSSVITSPTPLNLSGLNGYTNTLNTLACPNFTVASQTCSFTITTAGASTNTAQTATLSPSGFSSTSASFTVGGGV